MTWMPNGLFNKLIRPNLVALAALSFPALANPQLFSPSWLRSPGTKWQDNCSVLGDLKAGALDSNWFYFTLPGLSIPVSGDRILDSRRAANLRREFELMERDYEMRRNHTFLDPHEQQSSLDRMKAYGEGSLKKISEFQTELAERELRNLDRRYEEVRRLRKSAGWVLGSYMVFVRGTPVELNVNDSTRIRTRANLVDKTGEVSLSSAILDGGVEFSPNVISHNQGEKYKYRVSKALPIWRLASGLTYGSTSGTLGASLEAGLTSNLRGLVATKRPFDPQQSPVKTSEESLELRYEIHF